MSIRIFEHILGRKLLILLPVLIGAAAGSFWGYSTYAAHYKAHATIWAEKPADFTGAGASVSDFNPYISPAANYSNSLVELMGTKAFAEGVLQKVVGPQDEYPQVMYDTLRRNTLIWPTGTHIVYVQNTSDDAEYSAKVPKAIVEQFTTVFSQQLKETAGQASTFYKGQADMAKAEYDAATNELQGFIRANPQLASVPVGSQSIGSISDPQFGNILLRQRAAESQYNTMLSRYADSQIAATSAEASSSYYYLVDEPVVPQEKTLPSKKALLVKPAIGLMVGVVVAAALLLLTWRLDRKVRFATDLSFVGDNLTVVVVPVLKAKRGAKWPASFVRIGMAMRAGMRQLTLSHPRS